MRRQARALRTPFDPAAPHAVRVVRARAGMVARGVARAPLRVAVVTLAGAFVTGQIVVASSADEVSTVVSAPAVAAPAPTWDPPDLAAIAGSLETLPTAAPPTAQAAVPAPTRAPTARRPSSAAARATAPARRATPAPAASPAPAAAVEANTPGPSPDATAGPAPDVPEETTVPATAPTPAPTTEPTTAQAPETTAAAQEPASPTADGEGSSEDEDTACLPLDLSWVLGIPDCTTAGSDIWRGRGRG